MKLHNTLLSLIQVSDADNTCKLSAAPQRRELKQQNMPILTEMIPV